MHYIASAATHRKCWKSAERSWFEPYVNIYKWMKEGRCILKRCSQVPAHDPKIAATVHTPLPESWISLFQYYTILLSILLLLLYNGRVVIIIIHAHDVNDDDDDDDASLRCAMLWQPKQKPNKQSRLYGSIEGEGETQNLKAEAIIYI